MPGNKTFTASTLTAADVNAYLRGGNVMGYAAVTSSQGGIQSVTDLTGLSVTFTAIAGRLYRTTFSGEINGDTENDLLIAYITDGSNNELRRGVLHVPPMIADVGYSQMTLVRLTTHSAGSTTIKVRLERNAGVGTANLFASSTSPAVLVVEDIGVA